MDAPSAPVWEQRLRAALAGSNETEPRPLHRLYLPLRADKLFAMQWLADLRPAAVLVPVMRRPGGPTILLTRRSELLRSHTGQISFPGGRRDDTDLSAADNALRETEEEVGLPRSHVDVIGYLDDYPTGTRYRITPVVGIVSDPPPLRIDAAEVAEIIEVPLPLLLDHSNYRQQSMIRDKIKLPFYEVHFGDYRIWGATAGMLWNLCQAVNP